MNKKRRKKKNDAKPKKRISERRHDQLITHDLPELRRARALWAKEQIPEALRLFDRTVRTNPNNVLAIIDASRAFGSVYQYERAELLLKRLLQMGGDQPDILRLVGQTYRLMRRPKQAVDCFHRAAASNKVHPDIPLELAILSERTNDLSPAFDRANERLSQRPSDDEGLMIKGRILRRLGETAEAETILRDLTGRTSAHWLTRMRGFAELAALYDSQSAFDDAWRAMLEAKRIGVSHATSARQHRDRIVQPLASLAKNFSGDHWRRWRANAKGSDVQPVALLTGLPRSGTTLLQQILAAHSDVACGDEWDAFPRLILPLMLGALRLPSLDIEKLDQLPELHLARKRHMYFRSLAAALDKPLSGKVLIDKNPSLLTLVPPYLRLVPQAKLVIALRHPCDVLVSCLMTYFPLNDFSVDFLSLESAASRLTQDLGLWLSIRNALDDAWVEVKYEQLVDAYPSEVLRVLDSLGLEWDDRLRNYLELNEENSVHSPSYAQVHEPIKANRLGRWRNYKNYLEPVLPELGRLCELLGYECE